MGGIGETLESVTDGMVVSEWRFGLPAVVLSSAPVEARATLLPRLIEPEQEQAKENLTLA